MILSKTPEGGHCMLRRYMYAQSVFVIQMLGRGALSVYLLRSVNFSKKLNFGTFFVLFNLNLTRFLI